MPPKNKPKAKQTQPVSKSRPGGDEPLKFRLRDNESEEEPEETPKSPKRKKQKSTSDESRSSFQYLRSDEERPIRKGTSLRLDDYLDAIISCRREKKYSSRNRRNGKPSSRTRRRKTSSRKLLSFYARKECNSL